MVVVISVIPNKWGYLVVTFGLSLGRVITSTMVNRSLTRAEAIDAAVSTLTEMGVI